MFELSGYAPLVGASAQAASQHLAAASKRLQDGAASGGAAATPQVYTYLLDVPVSAQEVKRWGGELAAVGAAADAGNSDCPFMTAQAVFTLDSKEQRIATVHKLAPFPKFHPDSVVTFPTTRALKHRREWLPHRQRFAVHQQRTELLDALLNHSVVALVGSPGTGRTLQVPILVAETAAFKRRRIVIVAANETAARLTVHRLREERGEDVVVSRTVAAVLPLSCEATKGTVVVVTTAEVLRCQLLCDPTLVEVGCLIFDDTHLRSEVTEMCFAGVRDLLMHSSSRVPLSSSSAPQEAVRGLHVIVTAPDDQCAAPIAEYFAGIRTTTFTLIANPASLAAPAVLYVEETVQWLSKCSKEGRSCLCKDPDRELTQYVEDVDVVTRVMEAADMDFMDGAKCRAYWCDLIAGAVHHYDTADRAGREGGEEGPLPAIAVVVPNVASLAVVGPELWSRLSQFATAAAIRQGSEAEAREAAGDTAVAARFAVSVLAEGVTLPHEFLSVAQEPHRLLGDAGSHMLSRRLVVLCTPNLAQTALPSSMEIGLVVDCARVTHRVLDFNTMADQWVTEYATTAALRYRRSVAKLSGGAVMPMVVQLIPKSVLHSAQHRRLGADAGQHTVFRLPLERYVQLYQHLQARSEAAGGATAQGRSTPSVVGRIASLVTSHLVGVPAASSSRYEHLRRVLAGVEAYLVAAGHVDVLVTSAPASSSPSATGETSTVVRLKPLGVLTCCLPMAVSLARLLTYSSLFNCTVQATSIGALWATGDLFGGGSCHVGRGSQGAGEDDEVQLLRNEARLYFSRESLSDTASTFNLYKMWADIRQSGDADAEADFYDECGIPKAALERVAAVQSELQVLLSRTFGSAASLNGGASPLSSSGNIQHIVEAVHSLSDDAAAAGEVQACVSAALYPHCVVPFADGSALLLDGTHCVASAATGVTAVTRRLGAFADNSVLSAPESTTQAAGHPFLYLSKTVSTPGGPASVCVIEHGTPLHRAASILCCGEGHERLKARPVRCRGWTPALTVAWRHTRRARQLPPPSQLPAATVGVQPYDTVMARQVVLATDHNFTYTMRSTSSRWLLQLRSAITAHLTGLVARRASTEAAAASAKAIAAAWEWWCRREKNGREWLREERSILASAGANPAAAGSAEDAEGVQPLYPYYNFQVVPGTPQAVAPPQRVARAEEAAVQATVTAAVAEISGGGVEGLGSSAGGGLAHVHQQQLTVYSGKLPSADAEQIFRFCVSSVVERNSREAEAQLLRDSPEVFYFLDPESEYHGYYLHLLRQAAPDMEILGDNLEELVEFLERLEADLRESRGYPPAGMEAEAAVAAPEFEPVEDYQVHMATDADEHAGMGTWGGGGLQVETAAVNLRKAAAPTLLLSTSSAAHNTAQRNAAVATSVLPPPSSGQGPVPPVPDQSFSDPTQMNAEPPQSTGNFTFADPSQSHGLLNSSGGHGGVPGAGAPTLMQKLLAMQSGNKPEHTADRSTSGDTAPPTPTVGAEVQAVPNAADLLAFINASAPAQGIGPGEAQEVLAAPSAAELLALLAPHAPVSGAPPVVVNPLSKPPPPIPLQAIEERPPSVVVYPLPDPRHGNVPVILTLTLSETLGMRVGPATVVGKLARICVPNRKVEARALALKSYKCMGSKIYILKNDRIIDNPAVAAAVSEQMESYGVNQEAPARPDIGFPGMANYPHQQQQAVMMAPSVLPQPMFPGMGSPYGMGMGMPPPPHHHHQQQQYSSGTDNTNSVPPRFIQPPTSMNNMAADVEVASPSHGDTHPAAVGAFSDSDDE